MKKITRKKDKRKKNLHHIHYQRALTFLSHLSIGMIALFLGGYCFFISLSEVVHSDEKDTTHADIVQELRSETSYPLSPKNTGQIIFHGDTIFPKIALTFDADMTTGMEDLLSTGRVKSYYDDRLIQILETTHTKATLFLTGMWIETYKDTAQKLARNSLFEISNHSYDHRGFYGSCYGLEPLGDQTVITEVAKTQKLLEELGVQNIFFRFPGGCYSQEDLDILTKIGITPIQWDVAAVDGFNDDETTIEHNVLDNVKNGSIIVMHMNGYPNEPQTANAVAQIIPILRSRGFQFVTVSELLGL